MFIVILAAGVGSRLGYPFPKPLTPLSNGESILRRQLRLLGASFEDALFCLVVGFKKDMIIEEFPSNLFVYNEEFGDTNTSKSLLRGLVLTGPAPVLWLNGDVVFDDGLLGEIAPLIEQDRSFVCVDRKDVGDEEVKYTLDGEGYIGQISKEVAGGRGEAIGINYVGAAEKGALIRHLEECGIDDYFEKAIESGTADGDFRFEAVDISAYPCVEVDFVEDLGVAREMLDGGSATGQGQTSPLG